MIATVLAAAFFFQSGGVDITLTGTQPGKGHVSVQLCTADEYVRYSCARHQRVVPGGNQVTVHFDRVPAGKYAVMAYQDLDDDGTIDRNMTGIPTEPWGYSGLPEFMMGPPSFDSVAFDVAASGAAITIHMQQ